MAGAGELQRCLDPVSHVSYGEIFDPEVKQVLLDRGVLPATQFSSQEAQQHLRGELETVLNPHRLLLHPHQRLQRIRLLILLLLDISPSRHPHNLQQLVEYQLLRIESQLLFRLLCHLLKHKETFLKVAVHHLYDLRC